MKAIKLKDNLIIVSDEKIEVNDWMYNTYANAVCRAANDTLVNLESVHGDKCLKIAASFNPIEGIPSIQFANEEIREKLMGVDVEKLAEKWYEQRGKNIYAEYNTKPSYVEGFKDCQELNDKLFTLEDIEKAIEMAKEGTIGYYAPDAPVYYFDNSERDIIQSLQKKDFEVSGRFENGNFIIESVK